MKLNIISGNNMVKIEYNSSASYWDIYSKVEDEVYPKAREEIIDWMTIIERDDASNKVEKLINRTAHEIYNHSLDFTINEFMNNFKAILKKYGKYLVLSFNFEGIVFKDDYEQMVHLSVYEEEIYGNPLKKLIESICVFNNNTDYPYAKIVNFYVELLPFNKNTKSKRKRTHVPKGMRHEVFKRDNYTCRECGAKKEDGATLHIDHILPVAKGGTDELDNLQTLCSACNLNKSDVYQGG